MPTLRPYQSEYDVATRKHWAHGVKYVLVVSPTGSGKTVFFSYMVGEFDGGIIEIVHRNELVDQMSQALAEAGVVHRIIAPEKTVNRIIKKHVKKFGRSFHNEYSLKLVAGVKTLLSRKKQLKSVLEQMRAWVIDEAHHCLKDNQWGRAVDLLPNAEYGLGVTATAERTDGKGLGRHHDGLFEVIIEGPSARAMIDQDYLCKYRIISDLSNVDFSLLKKGSSGEYTQASSDKAMEKSSIIGDVVQSYIKHAAGKQGITFVRDVKTAHLIAAEFRRFGVTAEALDGNASEEHRDAVVERFRRGELLQLVNVDLFGEGFDVPRVEVISLARCTASFGLYRQMCGRVLRKFKGKTHGIIIDHIGLWQQLGLPDSDRPWSLDRRDKRAANKKPDDVVPGTSCEECGEPYDLIYKNCPHCGHYPKPTQRKEIKVIHGDLTEIDPATLDMLRGKIAATKTPGSEIQARFSHLRGDIGYQQRQHHEVRQLALQQLRHSIISWAKYQRAKGRNISEMNRIFYFKFKIDVMSAQALKTKDIKIIQGKIDYELKRLGVKVPNFTPSLQRVS